MATFNPPYNMNIDLSDQDHPVETYQNKDGKDVPRSEIDAYNESLPVVTSTD
jgi:hypothetical protein